MGQLKIGSESFNVEVEGPKGAPVLMLSNSLGTNLHMWNPQMPALAKRFRVVRYDARGHGHSVASEGPYSIAMLARDALAIMDELGLERVNWLGLSMGGMVGQWLLAHAGHRIERAVLANTSSYMPDARPWNARILTVQKSGMASVAQTVVDRWFTPEFQGRDPHAVEGIAEMLRTTPDQGYIAACAAVRDMDQRETIRSANRPVLVIAGTRDPATPPALAREIAASIPGAQYVEFDAAHLSNIEQAESFTTAVMNFLTAPARKGTVKKPDVGKKAPARKSAVKKSATRKTATRKSTAKKAAPKKAASKKAATKKAAAKKAPSRKSAVKKSAVKKGPAKKAAAKKSVAKKAAAKKAPARKPTRKAANSRTTKRRTR
jgi:3-oxoadipate enol-lactonase